MVLGSAFVQEVTFPFPTPFPVPFAFPFPPPAIRAAFCGERELSGELSGERERAYLVRSVSLLPRLACLGDTGLGEGELSGERRERVSASCLVLVLPVRVILAPRVCYA